MEKIFIDYMDKKANTTDIKNGIRNAILEDLISYLSERYENVRMINNTEFGFVAGCAPDENGFSSDVCITIKPVVRNWYNKECSKRDVRRFDLDELAEEYELERAVRESKKNKEK